ncbi:MAG: phage terminase large subunit [Pirellulales bacterium]
MFTPLTNDECELLLSGPDSEIEELLSTLHPDQQEAILCQLESHRPDHIAKLPKQPFQRQQDLLNLDCYEALYGGSPGGGKSEALLMYLAEGVHIPDYSAIIFRRTFAQLTKSNDSLVEKARRLYPSIGGDYNATLHQWRFPSGAMIEMGALKDAQSVQNYLGPAYHRIAFDELTLFLEGQYDFMVNERMRGAEHFPIPLGVRSSTNPDGPGFEWVKKHFITQEAIDAIAQFDLMTPTPSDAIFYSDPERAFVPSRLIDNPFLDRKAYIARLNRIADPVRRAKMLNGDWSVRKDGVIKLDDMRYFHKQGEMYRNHGETIRIDRRTMQRTVFVDCAGSSEEVAQEAKGKRASYSVAQSWDYDASSGNQFLFDMIRGRWVFPDLCRKVEEFLVIHRPQWTGIEDEKTGRALAQWLRTRGHNIRLVSHEGKDKYVRAVDLLNRIATHQVLVLENAPWLPELHSEWLAWTGHPEEPADTIDPATYAAREFQNTNGVFHLGAKGLAGLAPSYRG